MNRKWGILLMIIGVLLIAAAAGLVVYNRTEDLRAGREVALVLTQLEEATSETLLKSPDANMPMISVEGMDYIGTLKAERVGMDVPVLAHWDEEDAWQAPCRYFGSAYDDSLVVCGHNMWSHFAPLMSMEIGDEVTFTDVNGNTIIYEVIQIYNLGPKEIEAMITGDWDLTLFTCTYSGVDRVTVRCIRK